MKGPKSWTLTSLRLHCNGHDLFEMEIFVVGFRSHQQERRRKASHAETPRANTRRLTISLRAFLRFVYSTQGGS